MKLPYVPKSLPELIAEHQDRLNAVHGRGFGPTSDGRYLHWDKLRHLAIPDGLLSHEEWWLRLKLSRLGLQRELPLLDAGG